jgi:hypothetical protein
MVKVTGLQRPGRGTIGESASRRDYPMSTPTELEPGAVDQQVNRFAAWSRS